MNISNIKSAKMSYTETAQRDFIPTNLRLGSCYKFQIDDYNSVAFTFDLNKLLVPNTASLPPRRCKYYSTSGYDPNVGVATGMVQSFYDAPGVVSFNDDDTYTIEDGSIFKEELREINIGGGLEYEFLDVFAFRTGYFYEHYSKGNRQFVTLGAGIKYTYLLLTLAI